MHSPFPWSITLCKGNALQFLITDFTGNIVMISEVYNENDFLALMTLFQRNPEIRVDNVNSLIEQFNQRKKLNAEKYLNSLLPKAKKKLLKDNK